MNPFKLIISLLLIALVHTSNAQKFNIVGDAIEYSENWYILTPNDTNKAGAIWYQEKIDLRKDFEIYCQMNFGDMPGVAGADGIALMLQNLNPDTVCTGGGIGYAGIKPSITCEFDTYYNPDNNDPTTFGGSDHMSIQKNGITIHNDTSTLDGPIDLHPDITDDEFHKVIAIWDYISPSEQKIAIYYPDLNKNLVYTGNIIQEIFKNNPLVYIGFTSATGWKSNKHQVILDYVSIFDTGDTTKYCATGPIQLNYPIPGTNFEWLPNTYLTNANTATPTFAYPKPGVYKFQVKYNHPYFGSLRTDTITLEIIETQKITVNNDSICINETAFLKASGSNEYIWNNQLTKDTISTFKQAFSSSQDIQVIGIDKNGCKDTAIAKIIVSKPIIINLPDFSNQNICKGDIINIPLTKDSIKSIHWEPASLFDNADIPNTSLNVFWPYTFSYNGVDINNCKINGNIFINPDSTIADFGYIITDSISPEFKVDFTNLSSENSISLLWNFGDNLYSSEKNPSHTYIAANKYKVILTATNNNGCKDTATKTIILSQPLKYTIPNVITPNNDNINDIFNLNITGEYTSCNLQILNRWGKIVFETNETDKFWEGKDLNFNELPSGTYFYIITFLTTENTIKEEAGTITLIRDKK